MPRASRYLLSGYTYHLTHRCHDRRFLLKFKEERERYREWLRIAVKRHGVSVFGYCITGNHTHVVAYAHEREAIAQLMHLPSGAVAHHLNRRKRHEGSVWEHPYQCTIIQDGRHLLNCLRYVDLNMVRAGVVKHPEQWRWCGYDELVGARQRYRLIDRARLRQHLDVPDDESLARLHAERVQESITRRSLARQPMWTEGLAVGSREYVEQAKKQYRFRAAFHEYPVDTGEQEATWVVRESPSAYVADSWSKSAL